MSTIYELLRCKKGAEYNDDQIKEYSYLHVKPDIDKPAGALAGISRIHGDASPSVQDHVIDILVEIGSRYKLSYRDIAHLLLICKIESGFNPDAAAGTTSAAGLGQYTKATVKEAAKKEISKKRLGFLLDLSHDFVFDAERGAYGIALSFMIAKERAVEDFGKNYEKYLYLYHHEGWYFQATSEHLKTAKVLAVREIIDTKIIPLIGVIADLLSKKTTVSFKLITSDNKPYTDQPYVAIHPATTAGKKPGTVQMHEKTPAKIVVGRTNGEGKTEPVATSGLSEVLFVILNRDYKNYLDINKNDATNVHTVKKNETLAKIAKDEGVSVAEIQKLNHIEDANKIEIGQQLRLHSGEYLWRRPPMTLIADFLADALNMNSAAAPAVVEHKRSHIVLPKGNAAQNHAGDSNVVAIRGGASSTQIAERKKTKDIPHKTVEKNIKKTVVAPAATTGTVLREGMLFPLPVRSTQTYHTGGRRFRSSRGSRLHAGCDLFAPVGTEVRAMADGKVLNSYAFYWKTDAIEVQHGDFIVRYGEVAPMSFEEHKALKGKAVTRGEVIGKVGQLIKPNGVHHPDSMLHLEMYSSNQSPKEAPLTTNAAPFRRRADLVDPTATIDKCVDS